MLLVLLASYCTLRAWQVEVELVRSLRCRPETQQTVKED